MQIKGTVLSMLKIGGQNLHLNVSIGIVQSKTKLYIYISKVQNDTPKTEMSGSFNIVEMTLFVS